MAHPYHHALSSVRLWGGTANDYFPLHAWFDESKMTTSDFRHRALRHNAKGIISLERIYGCTVTFSARRIVPVRLIDDRHPREDLIFIPTFADWVRRIRPDPWTARAERIRRSIDPLSAYGRVSPSGTDVAADAM